MATAVDATAPDDEVLFFCDADLVGLTSALINEIIGPVIRGEKDMIIAQRSHPLFCISFLPKLGGVRAVRRSLWSIVPKAYKRRFQIEVALNHFSRLYGKGFGYKIAVDLAQVIKERKYGFVIGFVARIRMYRDVFWGLIRLRMAGVDVEATSSTPQILHNIRIK